MATEQEKTIKEIANNIEKLADSVSALLRGPLNRKALLILLASSTRMTQGACDQVLYALENLKKDFLKK